MSLKCIFLLPDMLYMYNEVLRTCSFEFSESGNKTTLNYVTKSVESVHSNSNNSSTFDARIWIPAGKA